MRSYLIILALIFSFSNFTIYPQQGRVQDGQGAGQDVIVKGQIVDSDDQTPIAGAHISFTHFRDSTRVYNTLTNSEGEFETTLTRGRYNMTASFVGYITLILDGEQAIRTPSEDNDLGVFLLKEGVFLEEVETTAYRPTARLRGDTLDFDAQAFKVNPDASAEDLIRRLPGVTVDGDRVSAQGEDVRRVLVDGREFFGDDPSIALRNLPAEIIDRVEVYDRLSDQSELTGFDDGQRSKTINIVTRLDARSGQFGRVYSGYGGDDRYQIGLSTNIFMDNSRLSILGMSNNINEQNFSREDIISLAAGSIRGGRGSGMGGGMGRSAQGGGSSANTTSHVSDYRMPDRYGDNTTHALGVNYSDLWFNNKIDITGSYFFNMSDNFTDQFTDRQYYIDDIDNQYYMEDSESASTNSNHRMNLRIRWDIDEDNSLILMPRMTLQGNSVNSYLDARNLLEGNNLLSRSETGYDSDLSGYNLSNTIIYRHRFETTGRTISTNFSTNINNNQTLYYLDALSNYFSGEVDSGADEDAINQYLINQESDSETVNSTMSGNITYTEPLGSDGLIQASYNISRATSENNRITNSFDPSTNMYDSFERELSSDLASNYLTHRGSLGYRLSGEKYNLTLEMGYQHASLRSEQTFPEAYELPDRDFKNFVPRVMLNYDIERGKSLRFVYRATTNPPSVTQLQDVLNNSNPVLLSSGNPDLDHSYSHFFMSRYNSTNTEKSTNLIAAIFGNISNDYIGNSTIIARSDTTLANGYELKKGSQFSQPVNLDGFSNIRTHLTYGFPLRFIRSNLNLNTSLAWIRTPSLINDNTNIANRYTTSAGFMLTSNISQNIDFSVSFNGSYNMVENSVRPQLDNNFYSQTSGVMFSFLIKENWIVRSDVSHLMYRGLGDGFNEDYMLWNMNIGRKIFRDNLGEITLSAFDLLNQNKNIVRNVSDSYVEDLRTNQLTRFFMLRFTYNLRNFRLQS